MEQTDISYAEMRARIDNCIDKLNYLDICFLEKFIRFIFSKYI